MNHNKPTAMYTGSRLHCAICNEHVSVDCHKYWCECWCERVFCSKECANKGKYVFEGDSYDTDRISCKECRTPSENKAYPAYR